MKLHKIVFVLVLGMLAIWSCKDKKETVLKSRTELMAGASSKSWKITKAEASITTDAKIDLVSTQQACITDNLLVFAVNGTYELREGASKCNAADPDLILSSNWSFTDNETKFKIDRIVFLGVELKDTVFEIVDLSENVFTGKTNIDYKGTKYQLVATFQAVK
ncbi:hypothetical protein [Emticicia fluvialis]|uniref:hypothetical protein n=1 Tax=Emticicia fluvialis TaxID=2974474 RepID=UPI002165592B|nr:hypothetical protein [Emticicia fluvialis]